MEDILIVQRFRCSRDESDCLSPAFMSIHVVSRCYFGGIVTLGTRARDTDVGYWSMINELCSEAG